MKQSLIMIAAFVLFKGTKAQLGPANPPGPSLNLACMLAADQDHFNNPTAWTIIDNDCGNGRIQPLGGVLDFSNSEVGGCNVPCTVYHGACNSRELRAYRPLQKIPPFNGPLILNNNSWRAECKFRITDGNGPSHLLLGFTAGNLPPRASLSQCTPWVCGNANPPCTINQTNQDGIFVSLMAVGQVPGATNSHLWSNIPYVNPGVTLPKTRTV